MSIRLLLILSLLYAGLFGAYLLNYQKDQNDTNSVITTKSDYEVENKSKFELTFFDVGQGDSIYIKLPTGERLLVDGGGSSDVDYKINQKFQYPECNFENIFLTHPHADHYTGLLRVTQHCNFKNFTFNDVGCSSKYCKYFSQISTNNSIKLGDIYTYKNVTIKVLWPDLKNTNIDYSNINNLSVVLFIDYGDFEALLTGDAEQEVLDQLDLTDIVPTIQNGLDVYKVPHHGAVNGLSLKLLNQLKPKNCVISVGANNKYGHPSPKTIEALKSILCKVYRTDELGDINFVW